MELETFTCIVLEHDQADVGGRGGAPAGYGGEAETGLREDSKIHHSFKYISHTEDAVQKLRGVRVSRSLCSYVVCMAVFGAVLL